MSRGASKDQHGVDPRRRRRGATNDAPRPLEIPALYDQGESDWDQGLCAEYAAALQQLYPSLKLGIIGEETEDGWNVMHVIAHDQVQGYDVTGAAPLPEIEQRAAAIGVKLQLGFSGPEAVQTSTGSLIQYPDEIDRARRLIKAVGELGQPDRAKEPGDQKQVPLVELADADLRQALEELAGSIELTEQEEDALGFYAGDEVHAPVNGWLRGQELSQSERELARAYISDLDQIFANAPAMDRPALVFRGIAAPELVQELDRGQALEAGYLSTSIDRERGLSYCREDAQNEGHATGTKENAGPGSALLAIEVPAGTPLLPVHEIVNSLPYGSEEEIILPRGGYLVLDHVDRLGSVPVYRVRYIAPVVR